MIARRRGRGVGAVLAALAGILLACGDPSGLISRAIYTQAAQGPGTRVSIVELMPFAFDTMRIFPPDAAAGAIRDSLGAAGAELDAERLSARGDSTLLVFVRRSRLVIAVPHAADRGRFHAETWYRALAPDDAVFVVDSAGAPGRPVLRLASGAGVAR